MKIPAEVLERPEGLDAEYSPEYVVEPEFIKDQTEAPEVASTAREPASRGAREGGRAFV